jgi:hypothetical protein
MTLWELKACCDGWNIANKPNSSKPQAPSDDEFWEAVRGEGKWQRSKTEPV